VEASVVALTHFLCNCHDLNLFKNNYQSPFSIHLTFLLNNVADSISLFVVFFCIIVFPFFSIPTSRAKVAIKKERWYIY
jgi:hypothetical protein